MNSSFILVYLVYSHCNYTSSSGKQNHKYQPFYFCCRQIGNFNVMNVFNLSEDGLLALIGFCCFFGVVIIVIIVLARCYCKKYGKCCFRQSQDNRDFTAVSQNDT